MNPIRYDAMFDYSTDKNDVTVRCDHLDLRQTLDCGQAFRWAELPSDYDCTFTGFYKKKPLTVSQDKDRFIFHNTSEDEFLSCWADYFDLNEDYAALAARLSEDSTLAAAVSFAPGIRILRQDFEECLISFIISQNNNIPRIKGIISRLCELCGGFPDISELRSADEEFLSPLRAGFRTKYLLDCVEKVSSGDVDCSGIFSMSVDEGTAELKKIKGVGEKVAKCVLLFGCHKLDAYPVDVWMKRVNERFYPDGLPECTRGIEGAAQQYLFYAIRNGAI